MKTVTVGKNTFSFTDELYAKLEREAYEKRVARDRRRYGNV